MISYTTTKLKSLRKKYRFGLSQGAKALRSTTIQITQNVSENTIANHRLKSVLTIFLWTDESIGY